MKCSWVDRDIFQNNTPLIRTEKPTHRKGNQYCSVILCGHVPLVLTELELAFGMGLFIGINA